MSNIINEFQQKFPKVILNEPLAKYCTYQIGGPADFFYLLKDFAELPELINFATNHQLPYFILAGGSNILFADNGFRGLIVKIATENIQIQDTQIIAAAGVTISQLIQTSLQHNLTGLEKWVGLPGTVGGAVRGNAGCNGLETKDILESAKIFQLEANQIITVPNNYFDFQYRYSKLKDNNDIVLEATFNLAKSPISTEEQQKIMQEIRSRRVKEQPFGLSIGSFFKNPGTDKPAGMLIDQAGLKGEIVGKAQISPKHGNFILNLGGATAQDIIALAQLAKAKVKAKFNIDLHEEVQILNEFGKITLVPRHEI